MFYDLDEFFHLELDIVNINTIQPRPFIILKLCSINARGILTFKFTGVVA